MKVLRRVIRDESIVWRGMWRVFIRPRVKIVKIYLVVVSVGVFGKAWEGHIPCGGLDARMNPRSSGEL